MGQRDILKILSENGWISSQQIAEQIQGLNINTIGDSLRRLERGKFIIKKRCDKFKNGYIYHVNDGTVTEDECK
jgi:predicted transcriptional regulator